MDSKQVIVDDIVTTYYQRGSSGKLVLMLHGWGDDGRTFDQVMRALEQDFRLVSLDLPGFGKTEAPSQAWGLQQYAEFVSSFLQKIKVDKTYAVVGHSNGGAIAIKALANRTIAAEKLVLVASSGVRDVDGQKKTGVRLLTKLAKLLTLPLSRRRKQQLREKLYKALGSDMLVVEHMQETFKKVVSEDVQNDASTVSTPSLLIYGKKDTATPVAYGELLHNAIPESRLTVIDGAGHFVHHDKPADVQVAIKEFLK